MIKKILFAFAIIATNLFYGQENTASPYSFYGVGITKFKGTNDIISMGGLTVYSDSIHVNLLNPASYGGQLLTGFAVGGTTKVYDFKSKTDNQSAKKTSIDYIYLAVPITNKIGLVAGLMPQTSVGYRFENDLRNTTGDFKRFSGNGGLNNVFLGTGYKLTKNFSIGLEAQYLFGTITTNSLFVKNSILLGSAENDESSLGGFALNLGLNYDYKFSNKLDFKSVLTFSPQSNITSKNTRRLSTVNIAADGSQTESNGVDINIANSTLTLPSKLTVGAGLGNRKWFVGADLTLKGSGSQLNRFAANNNVTYTSGTKITLGGFYIPKYDSYKSYLERITYRAGIRYENTGMVINTVNINDTAINLGLGFPLQNAFSQVNLGFEFGRLGTTTKNLIREDYFSLNIGLLFNDKWFRRPLYN
jgi:hypothetical protein